MKLFIAILLLAGDNKKGFSQKDFEKDTLHIESALRNVMDNGNTLEVKEAIADATRGYDVLLNKYYKSCLALLKEEDKKVLIESQRAWLTWMVKERSVLEVKYNPKYTGGGNLWDSMAMYDVLEIYKRRVFELFSHWQTLSGEY